MGMFRVGSGLLGCVVLEEELGLVLGVLGLARREGEKRGVSQAEAGVSLERCWKARCSLSVSWYLMRGPLVLVGGVSKDGGAEEAEGGEG